MHMYMYVYVHLHVRMYQALLLLHLSFVWDTGRAWEQGYIFLQERKVLAAQNIAMQGFVKLCSVFGDLLLVSAYMYM